MKFAYADPPYPGMANLYPEKTEVDHKELLDRLNREYPDGWVLSTASTTLQYVLSLCSEDVRVGAWVKPFCSFKPTQRVVYAWEPVIFRGGRPKNGKELSVRDWFSGNITMKKGLCGAKSKDFCFWILDLLGVQPGDEVDDIFPGTGIMESSLKCYLSQSKLDIRDPTVKDKSIPCQVPEVD